MRVQKPAVSARCVCVAHRYPYVQRYFRVHVTLPILPLQLAILLKMSILVLVLRHHPKLPMLHFQSGCAMQLTQGSNSSSTVPRSAGQVDCVYHLVALPLASQVNNAVAVVGSARLTLSRYILQPVGLVGGSDLSMNCEHELLTILLLCVWPRRI